MIKPVYVMFEHGVSLIQKAITIEALNEILKIGNSKNKIPVKDFGHWRNDGWKNGSTLVPYQSVDWYCDHAFNASRNQLDADKISTALAVEPWQKLELHHDILVTKRDLFFKGTNWVLGGAMHHLASISSVFRVEHWITNDTYLQNECFRSILLHEFGHMFGLISNPTRRDVEQSLGTHCINKGCIMRQGLSIDVWIKHTRERLKLKSPFCPNCVHDLQSSFI